MSSRKSLKGDLDNLNYMHSLIEAFQEIAALRMKKIKNSVLQTRNFLSDLNNIYYRVKISYQGEVKRINLEKKKALVTSEVTKKVKVLLSANTGLYGDIIRSTFDLFVEDIKGDGADIVIVGRLGKKMYESRVNDIKYIYFDLPDGFVNLDDMRDLVRHVLKYDFISVYHGMFGDILSQKAVKTSVTGDIDSINTETSANSKNTIENIFEPSLEEVLVFFEKQILSSLFEQTVYESSLSKFASRMINLDYSNTRIGKELKVLNFNSRKLSHKINNNSQQATLASISFWEQN